MCSPGEHLARTPTADPPHRHAPSLSPASPTSRLNLHSHLLQSLRHELRVHAGLIGDFDLDQMVEYNPSGVSEPGSSMLPVLLFLYVFGATVVLVNLLIAQMGATYDNVTSASTLLWQFDRVSLIKAHGQPYDPPSFILTGLDYICLSSASCSPNPYQPKQCPKLKNECRGTQRRAHFRLVVLSRALPPRSSARTMVRPRDCSLMILTFCRSTRTIVTPCLLHSTSSTTCTR